MIKPILAGILAAFLVIGGAMLNNAMAHGDAGHDYPEARSYTVSANATADVDAAFDRASQNDKRVLLVMGANWCHDSRALAGWLATERFEALVEAKYELVFVNVGMPQTGDGHNLEIAQRFGVEELPGTPNLLVLTAEGDLVNADTATTWRNSASRDEDAIYDELATLADVATPTQS